MKQAILLIAIITFFSCGTQKNTLVKKTMTAQKDLNGDLIGTANKASFLQAPYQSWFDANFTNYKIDIATTTLLKKHLKGVTIKGFMGTWCGDSKREIPHFYKVMEAAKFNFSNFELITVNRAKKTSDNLQKGFDIFRVPTFIFYKNGKEIGRFVEYPRESMEKDFLKIVSGKPYKHSYEK